MEDSTQEWEECHKDLAQKWEDIQWVEDLIQEWEECHKDLAQKWEDIQ
ncbi:hypothetical protein SAFG77S_13571 [Streptomyces afghaniensis]